MTAQHNAGPLLQTKLYIPRLRRGLVGRPRLIERLRRGTDSKLTLISAPAGFGKSTLLAEWMEATGRSAVHGVALARSQRQPSRVLLDVSVTCVEPDRPVVPSVEPR